MPTKLDNQSFEEDMVIHNHGYDGSYYNQTDKHVYSWVDSRSGTDNPAWRWQVSKHENATTTYSCVFAQMFPVNCVIDVTAKYKFAGAKNLANYRTTGRLSGTLGVWNDPASISLTIADRTAREQFIQKYRQHRIAFQGGTFLGELMETVHMIRRPAQALRDGIDDYYRSVKKRVRNSPVKHHTRIVQDTWLEYVFGWAPLISDIKDAAKLATADPYQVFLPITGHGIDVSGRVRSKGTFVGNGLSVADYVIETTSRAEVKIKGAIGAENNPPSFPEQLGLSWSNFLPTVWELIPYSFLFDYFSNVGKVIEGISTGTINLWWGCKNSWKINEQSIHMLGVNTNYIRSNFGLSYDYQYGYATGGGLAGRSSRYDRAFISQISLGIGDLHFKLPGSGTRWLNIAALTKLRT